MVFALFANSEKHSEIIVINLESDCSVGQVLISHREFSDTYVECRHSVFSSREFKKSVKLFMFDL